MDELLRDFIVETEEHLATLDRDLVALEQAPEDVRIVDEAFRAIHSVKGACGFLGLQRLELLLHAAENVLVAIRDAAQPVTPSLASSLIAACDRAKTILAALAEEGREPPGGDGDIIVRLELAGRPAALAVPPVARNAGEAPVPAAATANTIRIGLATIDRLMADLSELVLARNQLTQILRGRTDSAAGLALQRLSQATIDLQESVVKTRMQPIGDAWSKLPRLVRDLARELGKKIELRLEGGDTELDRQVLELVKDPFIHLVRNAADHGIEPPAERRRAGKRESGTLTLTARQEGSAIVITLTDDGRGIDSERIRDAIRRGGFASEAELQAMSEHQLQQFIFHPGFTTASRVTKVSGRGVGLDVVRANAEKIGGSIEIASRFGQFTRFTIKIPLTLAILPALLLDCAGQRFAIAQTAVAELVRSGAEHRIEWIHDAPMLRLRGLLLPLVALADLLGLGARLRPEDEDEALIAIIDYGAQRFGIIIDDADDAEEIVVKSLSPVLRGVRLFAGSTILGDGSVVLILDPGSLAAAVGSVDVTASHSAVATPSNLGGFAGGEGMLIFRAGSEAPKALPLGSILRIEEVAAQQIAFVDGKPMMIYRGAPLPLHSFGALPRGGSESAVIIVADGGRTMGFLADAIVDAIDETPAIDTGPARPGLRGIATVGDRLTEILDPSYYLAAAGAPLAATARSAA